MGNGTETKRDETWGVWTAPDIEVQQQVAHQEYQVDHDPRWFTIETLCASWLKMHAAIVNDNIGEKQCLAQLDRQP